MWVDELGSSGIDVNPFTPKTEDWYKYYENGQAKKDNQLHQTAVVYAGGNVTAEGGYQFTYDGENRLATSTINGAQTTYSYDGEGRRVEKMSCPRPRRAVTTTPGA